MKLLIALAVVASAYIVNGFEGPTILGTDTGKYCYDCEGRMRKFGETWGDCEFQCRCTCQGKILCTPQPACHSNAACVNMESGKFECKCKTGYQGNGLDCSPATCENPASAAKMQFGESFETCERRCTCSYEGNFECFNKPQCGKNAVCYEQNDEFECLCIEGYLGDGYYCIKPQCKEADGSIKTGFIEESCEQTCVCTSEGLIECEERNHCDINAHCTHEGGIHQCTCNLGYDGDGYNCEIIPCKDTRGELLYPGETSEDCETKCNCHLGGLLDCEVTAKCGANSHCEQTATGSHVCECNPFYEGDGYLCDEIRCRNRDGHLVDVGQTVDNCEDTCICLEGGQFLCEPKPKCGQDSHCSGRECVCNVNYEGDGYTCVLKPCTLTEDTKLSPGESVTSCTQICTCTLGGFMECQDKTPCDKNANCLQIDDTYECTCREHYVGDGHRCELEVCRLEQGDTLEVGEAVESCSGTCTCLSGNQLSCIDRSPCSENGECAQDGDSYGCRCTDGYIGDGYNCEEVTCQTPSGSIIGQGEVFTSCGEVCTCTGIGEANCETQQSCHVDAQCDLDTMICECIDGYEGDGQSCSQIGCTTKMGVKIKPSQVFENCQEKCICQTDGQMNCTEKESCGTNGHCESVNRLLAKCTCNIGYEMVDTECKQIRCKTSEGEGALPGTVTELCDERCECLIGGNWNCTRKRRCDENASCQDVNGSMECKCREEYTGDGFDCDLKTCLHEDVPLLVGESVDESCTKSCTCELGGNLVCNESPDCAENAICVVESQTIKRCECKPGYRGDGRTSCDKIVCETDHQVLQVGEFFESCNQKCECLEIGLSDCVVKEACSPHGTCSDQTSFRCECQQGWVGDGETCEPVTCKLENDYIMGIGETVTDCHKSCNCLSNGTLVCTQTSPCDANAHCTHTGSGVDCECDAGYQGDGLDCEATHCEVEGHQPVPFDTFVEKSCSETCLCELGGLLRCEEHIGCHHQASCNQQGDHKFRCVCAEGFVGSGMNCEAIRCQINGTEVAVGETVERCATSCSCDFDGGVHCRSKPPCDELAKCDEDTQYECKCNPGYDGDGWQCEHVTCETKNGLLLPGVKFNNCTDSCICTVGGGLKCNQTSHCDVNAVCLEENGSTKCVCNDKFIGYGKKCTSITCSYQGEILQLDDVRETCDNICTCLIGGNMECMNKTSCHENASCNTVMGEEACQCDEGFNGDGYDCSPTITCQIKDGGILNIGETYEACDATCKCSSTGIVDCVNKTPCHANARCDVDTVTCVCNDGWTGDGLATCDKEGCITQDGVHIALGHGFKNCTGNCICTSHNKLRCRKTQEECPVGEVCTKVTDLQSECLPGDENDEVEKQCEDEGGNKYDEGEKRLLCHGECTCKATGNWDCKDHEVLCKSHAFCSNTDQGIECICREEYQLVNEECIPSPCDTPLGPLTPGVSFLNCTSECTCLPGNNLVCEPATPCDAHAVCFVAPNGFGHCACNEGFEGDGRNCSQTHCEIKEQEVFSGDRHEDCHEICTCLFNLSVSCVAKPTCSEHATCSELTAFRCKCLPEYNGDGETCTMIQEGGDGYAGSGGLKVDLLANCKKWAEELNRCNIESWTDKMYLQCAYSCQIYGDAEWRTLYLESLGDGAGSTEDYCRSWAKDGKCVEEYYRERCPDWCQAVDNGTLLLNNEVDCDKRITVDRCYLLRSKMEYYCKGRCREVMDPGHLGDYQDIVPKEHFSKSIEVEGDGHSSCEDGQMMLNCACLDASNCGMSRMRKLNGLLSCVTTGLDGEPVHSRALCGVAQVAFQVYLPYEQALNIIPKTKCPEDYIMTHCYRSAVEMNLETLTGVISGDMCTLGVDTCKGKCSVNAVCFRTYDVADVTEMGQFKKLSGKATRKLQVENVLESQVTSSKTKIHYNIAFGQCPTRTAVVSCKCVGKCKGVNPNMAARKCEAIALDYGKVRVQVYCAPEFVLQVGNSSYDATSVQCPAGASMVSCHALFRQEADVPKGFDGRGVAKDGICSASCPGNYCEVFVVCLPVGPKK